MKRAEVIYQGKLIKEMTEDYSNDYVKLKTVRNLAEAQAHFIAQGEGTAHMGVGKNVKSAEVHLIQ